MCNFPSVICLTSRSALKIAPPGEQGEAVLMESLALRRVKFLPSNSELKSTSSKYMLHISEELELLVFEKVNGKIRKNPLPDLSISLKEDVKSIHLDSKLERRNFIVSLKEPRPATSLFKETKDHSHHFQHIWYYLDLAGTAQMTFERLFELLRSQPSAVVSDLDSMSRKFSITQTAAEPSKFFSSHIDRNTRSRRNPPTPDAVVPSSEYVDDYPHEEVSQEEQIVFSPVLKYKFDDKTSLTICNSDFRCLYNNNWINDTIIDFFLKYRLERSDNINKSEIELFSSFFYTKLVQPCKSKEPDDEERFYENVRTWFKNKNDIFSKKHLVIPINQDLHWYCAIVNNLPQLLAYHQNNEEGPEPKATIYVLDSLRQSQKPTNPLKLFLVSYAREKYGFKLTSRSIVRKTCHVPKQTNFNDCGIHVIYNATKLFDAYEKFLPVFECKRPVIKKNGFFNGAEREVMRSELRGDLLKLLKLQVKSEGGDESKVGTASEPVDEDDDDSDFEIFDPSEHIDVKNEEKVSEDTIDTSQRVEKVEPIGVHQPFLGTLPNNESKEDLAKNLSSQSPSLQDITECTQTKETSSIESPHFQGASPIKPDLEHPSAEQRSALERFKHDNENDVTPSPDMSHLASHCDSLSINGEKVDLLRCFDEAEQLINLRKKYQDSSDLSTIHSDEEYATEKADKSFRLVDLTQPRPIDLTSGEIISTQELPADFSITKSVEIVHSDEAPPLGGLSLENVLSTKRHRRPRILDDYPSARSAKKEKSYLNQATKKEDPHQKKRKVR